MHASTVLIWSRKLCASQIIPFSEGTPSGFGTTLLTSRISWPGEFQELVSCTLSSQTVLEELIAVNNRYYLDVIDIRYIVQYGRATTLLCRSTRYVLCKCGPREPS